MRKEFLKLIRNAKGNVRPVILTPRGADLITRLLADSYEWKSNTVCALTLAGSIMASLVVARQGCNGILLRYEQKPYDLQKQVEGEIENINSVVIFDDILRRDGLVSRAIGICRQNGIKVEGAVAVVDYEEGERERLQKKGYYVRTLYRIGELK
jgi:orotate phosphoribosyltransferase